MDLLVLSKVDAEIGDYQWSHLSETDINDEKLGTWMLVDGRSCVGTAFASKTGEINIPNAAADGSFVRQTGPGRNVGTHEEDTLQGHNHASESWAGYQGTGDKNPNNQGYGGSGPYGNTVMTKEMKDFPGNGTVRYGPETRPKNIALNLYVKVNY